MKIYYTTLISAALIQPMLAQAILDLPVAPPPAPAVIVEEVVITPPPGDVVVERVLPIAPPPPGLDPTIVRRQLSMVPREVVIPVNPPGTVVETVETTQVVEVPGLAPRVYNMERNVVIVEGRELPYVTIPVLFVKETAELLDTESRMSLEETAAAILEVLKTQPTAMFVIEGHTSTDGTDEFNLKLSADRALRIHQELTQRYSVPAASLSAKGFGEMYPMYPNGTEEQMATDRRVLVVREK